MIKILSFILMLFLLQSCFWSSGDTGAGLTSHETDDFTILIPDSWNEVSGSDLPTPKSGELVLAYVSKSERQGYLNNIVVLKTQSQPNQSPESLTKNSLQSLKDTIDNFEIIEETPITFSDNESGSVLIYSGKYNSATPETIYLQTIRQCDNHNYHLTLSLAEKLESYDRYTYVLQTFGCK